MKLLAFQITNFRSIAQSDWIPFSPDGITVLVGQNESGKTSVLDALHCGLSNVAPTVDDFRTSAPLPNVNLRVEISAAEITSGFEELSVAESKIVSNYVQQKSGTIEINISWKRTVTTSGVKYEAEADCTDHLLKSMLEESQAKENIAPPQVQVDTAPTTAGVEEEEEEDVPPLSSKLLADVVWDAIPAAVPFNEETGRLPNTVDIDEKGNPTGPGARAAANFLAIADVNLPELLKDDKRARENKLNRANSRVSQDFNAFWSQTIGKEGKLSLKCDIDNYPATTADKAGKAHLVFWICDGNTQLYPKQRSQGVRWFVSFYLQLKASEKTKNRRVFLLDEPGANLHSKAQGDVLKLINKLGKDTSTVVYTTHSPQMIEYPKLFRVHAVQRDGDLEDSPTTIIDAHRLGAATTDTLSPVLAAMGADLSQHQVVKKKNNVLLEEMSGYYYLTAFWKLAGSKKVAHFIAATGVNKIEVLANMFRGWGLDFVVAIDDDKQGREVFKNLKKEHFGDVEEIAKKKLLKLPHGTGIEDIFSIEDFKKHVLDDDTAVIAASVTDFLKTAGRSKPVIAFHFALAVEKGTVKMADLSPDTQIRIEATVKAIEEMLSEEA